MGKKNVGQRGTIGGSAGGGRPGMIFCPVHQVLSLKKYPHVCDGIPVETKKGLKGRKKKRE